MTSFSLLVTKLLSYFYSFLLAIIASIGIGALDCLLAKLGSLVGPKWGLALNNYLYEASLPLGTDTNFILVELYLFPYIIYD